MNATAAATEGSVRAESQGHLLHIVIDRPAKLNGFTPKMLAELAGAYTRLECEDAARVGVLSAQGAHFTAGLDLPKVAPLIRRGDNLVPAGCIDPLDRYPPRRAKPVVAAVKGITYTIGIELMLAADIVVAASDCRFAQLEVRRGIMATGGATLRMVERAGWGNAMVHLLTGDEFDAAAALRCNYVQEVVPAGQELRRAIAIAERIAQQAPLAVRASRASARTGLEAGFDAAVAEFRAVNSGLSETADAAEGVRSFLEKRPPRFLGH
ncbi:MAG: crotonase/enoyl-CoA hydratase family protein [Alphaproteobacteria bacterium]|nr:crotonase/enoyl-CoA hydratase family protein [Alphaproteobacteria bacterium]